MLSTEPIREAMHRNPFLPFKIQMRGGKVHEVKDPDHIAISPNGKSAVVLTFESVEMINVRLIAELVVPGLEAAPEAPTEPQIEIA